ncbi:Putative glycoside hydrolase family 16, concanavalin A-like lectin/glucanase domain superfamily [Septoria linicola]|uniref:Glycoside hydrolase family 16, concanavalin A-like lectin/glucanase domain superfamily n=1 Tax=Septoria linicola TaxID=215465 RepID=A0A9Q9B164_9PEZI|nr:putative glycoside hydrolase family 16, concanavalin A-like lectin/glucanase domain superfamily [Septoria linicola]USW59074.1 Putative glycoside hydrolase family 16, concanavalin A-like lectin/glucanase domain superfamily [Septoria linicola]
MLSTSTILTLAVTICTATASVIPRGYTNSTNTTTSGSAYTLIAEYSGATFFDHFTAFTGQDPTNGHVQYQTLQAAADQQLIGFIHNSSSNSDTAYIGVDSKNAAPNGRNSVRLTSKDSFSAGSMAVIDVRHAPSQYGVWPAIWMLGSEGTWPESGESDILEYVHRDDYNAMTLHTSPDCVVDNVTTTTQQGRLIDGNCNAGKAFTGCSVKAYNQNTVSITSPGTNANTKALPSTKTFATAGSAFNTRGGTVYIHDWQPTGITIWSFPRSNLPADLLSGSPQPSTWTQTPLAKFTGSGCKFDQAFKKMQLIINITFCGEWAGKVWESSGAMEETGYETCEEWVSSGPEKFEESFFEIGSVKFYSSTGEKPGNGVGV